MLDKHPAPRQPARSAGPVQPPLPPNRQQDASDRRAKAGALHGTTAFVAPEVNGDEVTPYLFSFTKGLRHSRQGIVEDPAHFETFRSGTASPDPGVFETVPINTDPTVFETPAPAGLAGPIRKWESPTAGHAFVLQGPDPMSIGMPRAPAARSAELAAEMAEVYQMALLRDYPVAAFMDEDLVAALDDPFASQALSDVSDAASRLSGLRWFCGEAEDNDIDDAEKRTRRRFGQTQTPRNMFRGIGEGTHDGPFVSQFMVVGSKSGGGEGRQSGHIRYGNQRVPQTVRMARPGRDFMTSWNDWLDVQNGYNARHGLELAGHDAEYLGDTHRPLTTLRDLATYVHDDALYQAYLNAALILLSEGAAVDRGIPYHGGATRTFGGNQAPFAIFGGPHLLTLVTEVSSRALRAVRAAKFSVHRRCRPEVLAARFHTVFSGYDPSGTGAYDDGNPHEQAARQMLSDDIASYTHPTDEDPQEPSLYDILSDIRAHNAAQNGADAAPSWLLPMAFPEGSPMHPAYGAGHATVAGACVTVLKAFFEMGDYGSRTLFVDPAADAPDARKAYVPVSAGPDDPGGFLKALDVPGGLTLVGELNKLAWNISNARNIAGVHYYTDYIESLLLGEAIAIGILREQMCTYDMREQVEMTLPLFVERTLPDILLTGPDGTASSIQPGELVKEIRILSDGRIEKVH